MGFKAVLTYADGSGTFEITRPSMFSVVQEVNEHVSNLAENGVEFSIILIEKEQEDGNTTFE